MPAPRSVNPNLPPNLDEIIHKALDKDLETRYQSAAEMRGHLKRLKREMASSAGVSAISSSTAVTFSGGTSAGRVASIPKGRPRWMLASVAVLLLAGLAAVFFAGQQMSKVLLPSFWNGLSERTLERH